MSGVVIVGAGHAGSQFAVALRAEGYLESITLIDPSGELPYHKPPLSKTFLKTPEAEPQLLRSEQMYQSADVKRLDGTVTAIDPSARTIVVDGASLAYDELVLATGARNRMLPDLADAENVHSLRDLRDARRLRDALSQAQSIVVIGGGFIGLETAAALATMRKTVTVLEAAERVLARVAAAETSLKVSETLAGLGVTLLTGWTGTGYRRDSGRVTAVEGRAASIACDVILVGIGAMADVALARAAGISCNQGILTDGRLQTSDPHIWAIGDVAETPHWQLAGSAVRIESVQNATDQARYLARRLSGKESDDFRTVPWFWSDIGPVKLQIAGLATGSTRRLMRDSGEKLAVFHFRDDRLVSVETINSPADHMIARQVLDAGKTPPDDVLLEGAAAIKAWLAQG